MSSEPTTAFGGPGIAPTFAAGDKDAVTTSLGSSRVWATVGGGVLNEVFWPTTGRPQLRDLGFLVTGPDFWTEVKRVADYTITTPHPALPLITAHHTHDRYTLRLDIVCDPHRDCVLVRYELQARTPGETLELHVLAAPHVGGSGHDNSAAVLDGHLVASRDGEALAIVDAVGFTRASAGFVGASDGWQDCTQHGAPTWAFTAAPHGNVALTGTCANPAGTLALSFATTAQGACTLAIASLLEGFDAIAADFTAGWQMWGATATLPHTGDDELDAAAQTSAMVLKVHEDRTFPGAIVASLATPWGIAHDDPGGYHLVWPRDCAEAGLALAAIGLLDDARRMVWFLASTQSADGHWPQNFTPDGAAYWSGIQLDETALPVILAVKLHERGALDLRTGGAVAEMIRRACAYLAATGPFSAQDRWEEVGGVSPFSAAAAIAALVGAAASGCLDPTDAEYARSLADWWNARIDDVTYVRASALDARLGTTGHYVRIGPPASKGAVGRVVVANRGGDTIEPSELVGLEFLALVRYGLRAPDDPEILDTVAVIDDRLRVELPTGVYYRRYPDDGYGEHVDGAPFDGTGVGRLWPLLTGERGYYAYSAGADALPYLRAIAQSRSRGGLFPEQVWDADDIPERRLVRGKPTGSATPLVWAHAEYLKLYAAHAGAGLADRLTAVVDHFAVAPAARTAHVRDELDAMITADAVIIEWPAPFLLHVGVDGWQHATDLASTPLGLGMHGVAVPPTLLDGATTIEWTRQGTATSTWEPDVHVLRRARPVP